MSDGQLLKLRLSLMGRPVRNYTFEKPVIAVGRDPAADVYVDNPGVSRDHFRLEKTETGEYRIVDLGSANGTFVNDQMVNTTVVHNNDVVRFGKYTLWVGYEQDRRAKSRAGDSGAPVSESERHTVVLSRAEIGHILEREPKSPAAKVIPMAMPTPGGAVSVPPPSRTGALLVWGSGFVVGALAGAAAVWLFLRR
ncbi:MAG: FHA domain-containing protein [Candidatus Eisenbacteria bacterium]|nr:FHA domain-containing protein [Candidatus Eisenbacteria bacterium]